MKFCSGAVCFLPQSFLVIAFPTPESSFVGNLMMVSFMSFLLRKKETSLALEKQSR